MISMAKTCSKRLEQLEQTWNKLEQKKSLTAEKLLVTLRTQGW
jgi:hypothetical protein